MDFLRSIFRPSSLQEYHASAKKSSFILQITFNYPHCELLRQTVSVCFPFLHLYQYERLFPILLTVIYRFSQG